MSALEKRFNCAGQNFLMNEKYRLQHRIGGGNFIEVYLDILIKTRMATLSDNSSATEINIDEEVAIKLKYMSVDSSLLREEIEIYNFLTKDVGIPIVY
jgi:hypothetical protein